jgi:hypothetical protein
MSITRIVLASIAWLSLVIFVGTPTPLLGASPGVICVWPKTKKCDAHGNCCCVIFLAGAHGNAAKSEGAAQSSSGSTHHAGNGVKHPPAGGTSTQY